MTITNKWIQFLLLYIIANFLIIVASYITVPYPHLSSWKIFLMAIPFAFVSRIFLTGALTIQNDNNLLDANSLVFLLIILQFIFVLIGNYYYLNEQTTRSEYFAFVLLIIAYIINNYNIFSRILGIPIPPPTPPATTSTTSTTDATATPPPPTDTSS